LIERYAPVSKDGQNIVSGKEHRVVKPSEGCNCCDFGLRDKLLRAKDKPIQGDGTADPRKLPKFYRDWSRIAWQEMLKGLLPEQDTAEIDEFSEDRFTTAVILGLLRHQPFGFRSKDFGEVVETRSLIDWVDHLVEPDNWQKLGGRGIVVPNRWIQLRSCLLWFKTSGHGATLDQVLVAARWELFASTPALGLSEMGFRCWAALCRKYGLGEPDDEKTRPGGQRAVIFTTEFLRQVRSGEGCVDGMTENHHAGAHAPAREKNCVIPSTVEQKPEGQTT
jgi:hypothetical protein